MFSFLTNPYYESFYQWQAAIATAAGFILPPSPAFRAGLYQDSPTAPPTTHPPNGSQDPWKSQVHELYSSKDRLEDNSKRNAPVKRLLIKMDLKRTKNKVNNHSLLVFLSHGDHFNWCNSEDLPCLEQRRVKKQKAKVMISKIIGHCFISISVEKEINHHHRTYDMVSYTYQPQRMSWFIKSLNKPWTKVMGK